MAWTSCPIEEVPAEVLAEAPPPKRKRTLARSRKKADVSFHHVRFRRTFFGREASRKISKVRDLGLKSATDENPEVGFLSVRKAADISHRSAAGLERPLALD